MDLAVSAHHSFLEEMTINNPLVSLYFLLFSVLLQFRNVLKRTLKSAK